MTANPLDIRLAHLEGAYEQISDRLNGFDTRFATIEQKIDSTRESLDAKFDSKIDGLRDGFMNEMNRRFERVDDQFAEMRKLVIRGGFAIGAFVLVSILLPLVQRFH